MILRGIACMLIILFFSVIALIMVSDLSNAEKKISSHSKNNKSKINSKRTHYH